jgi:hypothetical protein
MTISSTPKGTCDYLVVGAGAAAIAFIDTLLTELPSAKIVLVDKHQAPGGHWNDAYDFVRLHQPSLLYGVASRQLEGNWAKLMLTKATLPWNHRASKDEILTYFQGIVDEWIANGQVQYYPKCAYDFEQKIEDGFHSFSALDGPEVYKVKVSVKFVNGILGECKVPSQCPVEFPVDQGVDLITPNKLYQFAMDGSYKTNKAKKYVILGGGKTAMDTAVFMQRVMKIKPDDITWVVPNDVWMLNRGGGGPWDYPRALISSDGDKDKACLHLEEKGCFFRLDKNVQPTQFRFPVIGHDELKLLRKIKSVVRRGRVASIAIDEASRDTVVKFGPDQEPLALPPSNEYSFIHCTSPGPFNGNKIDELFPSDEEMRLFLLFAPPVSVSMSCLAKLESARRNGTLDLNVGRKLLIESGIVDESNPAQGSELTENDVLRHLVHGYSLSGDSSRQLDPIKLLAVFLVLLDKDPMVGYKWLAQNRLSFFSVPGFKCGIYEDLLEIAAKKKTFGISDSEAKLLLLMSAKLEPLKGK